MTNKIRHVRSGFVAVCRGFNDLRRVLTALSIAGGSMLDDRATAALCTQFLTPLHLTAQLKPPSCTPYGRWLPSMHLRGK